MPHIIWGTVVGTSIYLALKREPTVQGVAVSFAFNAIVTTLAWRLLTNY